MGFNHSPSSEEVTSFGGNACFNVVIWQVSHSYLLQSLPGGLCKAEAKTQDPQLHVASCAWNLPWGSSIRTAELFVQLLICPTETYGVPTTRLAWLLLNLGGTR